MTFTKKSIKKVPEKYQKKYQKSPSKVPNLESKSVLLNECKNDLNEVDKVVPFTLVVYIPVNEKY